MPGQRIAAIISKTITPSRIFIALMLAVSFWLLFTFIPNETPNVYGGGFSPGARCDSKWDKCSSGHCCGGECVSDACGGGGNQPPVIAGSLTCLQPGNNGWCLGSLTLDLIASDPQGQPIIISGDVNGLAFACPAGNANCSVPLTVEGYAAITYIVNSSTGLSASGTAVYQLDFSTPQISGSLNGTNGTNGWFISDIIFSASAVDSISGLAALQTSTDGGAWINYTAPITLGDGVHTLALLAYDYAGNVTQTARTISVDTITPLLDSSVSGVAGTNGWYVSNTRVSASASDLGSGLSALEAKIDGGAWAAYTAPIILSDGIHAVQFRATDKAGNVTESTQTVKVDTITPALNLSVNGTKGFNGWYTSITQVLAAASDSGSGVVSIEATSDNGAWAIINSLPFSDGLHTYQFKAKDNAGNTITIPVQNIKVDTIAPFIDMTETLSLGEEVDYELTDGGSGLSIFRTVIEDDAEKYKKIVWLDDIGGDKLQGQILWDGKFADGAQAGVGDYFITLKISDAAGNERMKSAVVSVNLLSFLQDIPVFIPHVNSSLPSQEGLRETGEGEQSTAFGHTNSEATGEAISLSSSSGGLRAGGAVRETQEWLTKPVSTPQPEFPLSGILWGTAATALVGATLAEWERQREEAERAKQLEREERLATGHKGKGEKGEGNLVTRREAEKEHDAAVRERWEQQAKDKQQMANGINSNDEARLAAIQVGMAYQREKEKAAAKEAADLQAGLLAYYQGRKAGETPIAPPKNETNWLSNLVNTGSTFVKKNIVPTLLTIALGVTGVQWVNNIVSNQDLFLPIQLRTELLIEELRAKHPPVPESGTLNYLLSRPYDVFATGTDVLNTFTDIAASYADAIWRENPLVRVEVRALEFLEKSICSGISNQGWANRCTAAFYLPAGLIAAPFDTGLGIVNSFVVDPVEGVLKQGALTYENICDSVGVIDAIREDGLMGGVDFLKDLVLSNFKILLSDKQLQSALVFEVLMEAAILAAPIAGGVVLGMTAKGLIDLDDAIASTTDKKNLIEFVTSHGVRTTVVSSILILALMAAGLGEKALEFRNYQNSLSPTGQAAFAELSLSEQIRIVELAIKMKLPSGSLEFYLTESMRSGSSLAKLPLVDALRVSSLVEVYGEGATTIFLKLCEKYDINLAEILKRPLAQGQSPNGLVLGIENPDNPVNHPYLKLNLTETEINQILTQSIKNPDSKVIVLGYGNGAKPYYILGNEIDGSYLSIDSEAWTPFEKARANFFFDVNAPFIEMGIENRKIFLFNIEYDVIINPRNVERFSLPELRLIELEKNNYVNVSVGDYTAFVPMELLDTYRQYLPANILGE